MWRSNYECEIGKVSRQILISFARHLAWGAAQLHRVDETAVHTTWLERATSRTCRNRPRFESRILVFSRQASSHHITKLQPCRRVRIRQHGYRQAAEAAVGKDWPRDDDTVVSDGVRGRKMTQPNVRIPFPGGGHHGSLPWRPSSR
jgi:hypothetical protein